MIAPDSTVDMTAAEPHIRESKDKSKHKFDPALNDKAGDNSSATHNVEEDDPNSRGDCEKENCRAIVSPGLHRTRTYTVLSVNDEPDTKRSSSGKKKNS